MRRPVGFLLPPLTRPPPKRIGSVLVLAVIRSRAIAHRFAPGKCKPQAKTNREKKKKSAHHH
jgi:hypothetical protein